jgi:hypothetical protein
MNNTTTWLLAALLAGAGACDCGSETDSGDDGGVGEPSIASSRAKLRFKDGKRLQNDYAFALGLETEELCNELGQYSCVGDIHTIALLGVEPYNLGFYEPLAETAVTTPIAVERVAIAGCTQRVERDLGAGASALIFQGDLSSAEAPGVIDAVDRLYKRALQRRPTSSEVGHLQQLYRDIAAAGSTDTARDWAKGACFAVLTTLESLFY